MKNLIPAFILSILLTACNDKPKDQTVNMASLSPEEQVAYKIAKASGIDNWGDVEELDFTFNVDRGENHMARAWAWKTKTGDIVMKNPQDTVEYNRSQMDSLATTTDKGFINDSFWLLAPYHLIWDKGSTSLTVQDTATAPMSKETLSKITMVYGDQGGYTPGDAYDFYYDKDFIVKEWVYRRGNADAWSMVTSWEDYKDFSGLKIAETHNTEGNQVKLYFTDIAVKTED
ncbi:MAG: hypothetical protein CL868_17205 [Cytophagaceae bacterium]|nr:hypothetical protein [Cytophagaceae bacterium]|tara:strand:- start:301 stop:990 length:690 start_codon:yes stop_codon:yes gene_type:complete